MTETRSVGIFRLQLFKVSERFIPNQAESFRRYRPIYIGRKRFGEGPAGATVIAPDSGDTLAHLRTTLLRSPDPYLRKLNSAGLLPRLIHAHFAVDAVYAVPLAARLRVPLITTLHGFDVSSRDSVFLRSMRPALVNAVIRRTELCRRGDLFLCVSEFVKRKALEKGFPADRLLVHHIGIDTETLVPVHTDREPRTIIHVARLVEKKGTTFLLEAMKALAPKLPDLRLRIVGDGPLRQMLEEQARPLGRQVEFLGARDNAEVLELIAGSTVVAVPSVTASSGDSEGLPIVTLEAAALATPIVASDSGGIAEAVVDGKTGYVVAERNVAMLAERLHAILTDPGLGHEMGAAARHHIENHFDLRRQSARLEEIYDTALGETLSSGS
jgi:glycosyltransferase involved in cell wall biosynthesis